MPGAGQRLQPADIEAARDAFAQSAVLLIQGEIPIELSAHAARLARSLGGRVMFNASPAPADAAAIPDALWSAVDVLLVNGTEAERLSGMSVADVPAAMMAAEALRRRFGIPTVIITLGGRGAIALDERGTRHLPSWPVPVVETIGAGDAFAGVLASELARGRQLDEALPLANAAGALAVTRPGAHDSLPTGAQIRAFLAERQPAESYSGVGDKPVDLAALAAETIVTMRWIVVASLAGRWCPGGTRSSMYDGDQNGREATSTTISPTLLTWFGVLALSVACDVGATAYLKIAG